MDQQIARKYVANMNPDGAYIAGVPLRDLTVEEYEALPAHIRGSVDNAPFFRKPSAPRRGKKEKANGNPV